MVDVYCASYAAPPAAVTLDIDDTVDVVHGHQQLSLFNAHYDERCFLPIHVYDTATGRPVAVILRPGKTPSGKEVRGHLRRLVRRLRAHWPATRITIRGDGHYGRPEAMECCEKNGVGYLFGITGNGPLRAKVEDAADAIRVERALTGADAVRGYAETTYRAKSWTRERRVVARIEATTKSRFMSCHGEWDLFWRVLDPSSFSSATLSASNPSSGLLPGTGAPARNTRLMLWQPETVRWLT